MSSKTSDNEFTARIINLDFLRGIFIILALDQHFTYYINMWYVEYFKDTIALTTTYGIHFPMIGKQVSTDNYNHFLAIVFTPWVSQIYLTMASFNLAKRTKENFQVDFFKKINIFGVIFLFFVIENLIVAPNLGQGISFYPIMLWMIILALIAFLYKSFGIKGVFALSAFGLIRFIIPMEEISNSLEDYIKIHIHPGFEYDARLEYFIFSGCLGFIMGYGHYHLSKFLKNKDLFFTMIGLGLVLIYVLIGDSFHVYHEDVFRTEHDLARTFSGTAYILGIQAIVISFFLWIEKRGFQINLPVINWVGLNSLLVFAFHRIFFVKVLAPLSVLWGSLVGRTIGATILETFTYIFITLVFCYFIKRTRVIDIIVKR